MAVKEEALIRSFKVGPLRAAHADRGPFFLIQIPSPKAVTTPSGWCSGDVGCQCQNCSADKAITGEAPLRIRAKWVRVAGSCRCI